MLNRGVSAALVAIAVLPGLAACSSDKTTNGTGVPSAATTSAAHTSSPTASSSGIPSSGTPSALAVRQGLLKISELAGKIATTSATNPAEGKKESDGIEPLWAPIEDVVKENDSSAYLTFEDSFALLESGDTKKAVEGASKVAVAVTAYIAKYPG